MTSYPMLDEYWFQVSDLTIFDAAFWMQVGSDPRWPENHNREDDLYTASFDNSPSPNDKVLEQCEVIVSAIRAKLIATTVEMRVGDYQFDVGRTLIQKSEWIDWCKKHGHSELAKQFLRKSRGPVSPTQGQSPADTPPRDWREMAREIADELFDHDTEQKTRDSLANYSTRVMDKMQEREIHGPRGRIDNPKTIQRDALQADLWWKKKKK